MEQKIKQFISLFLEMNPDPSDAQVHQLAAALGVDKETLEAIMYAMLSDCIDCSEVHASHDDLNIEVDGEADIEIETLPEELPPELGDAFPSVDSPLEASDIMDNSNLTEDRLIDPTDYSIEDTTKINANTEDVLDGEYDPATTPADEVVINDGEMDPTEIIEDQRLLMDDGAVETDDDQHLTDDDGVADTEIVTPKLDL